MYSSGGLDSFSSGTFWAQGQGIAIFGSPIEDILSKENFTLEDILDEDTAIQETKAGNEKLVDFLKEPQTLERLLCYVACTDMKTFNRLVREGDPSKALASASDADEVANGIDTSQSASKEKSVSSSAFDIGNAAEKDAQISSIDIANAHASAHAEAAAAAAASLVVDDEHSNEPSPQEEAEELHEERLMRFPFIACEIICCSLTQIIEPIVNSADLLSKFFSLLDQDPPLDSRLAGYFFKILTALLTRAPEKILWFSIYRNVDISTAGCEDGIDEIGWLMPKLLKHIDSYSVMCCFKSLLQVAADENALGEADDDDEDGSLPGYGQSIIDPLPKQIGDLDGRDECDEDERNALMRDVRSVWLGGRGAAQAVLNTLAASDNSDSHNNAAELLADMIHRAAMARLALQHVDEEDYQSPSMSGGIDGINGLEEAGMSVPAPVLVADDLPTFSAFVLEDKGKGASAETAIIESGVEWTLELCKELLSVALFEPASGTPAGQEVASQSDEVIGASEDEDEGNLLLRTVERGSASVASLQVLTHLVSAFALERWSEPSSAMKIQTGESHVTTVEKHSDLPEELDAILNRLGDLTKCLLPDRHAELFGISKERAERVLGMHRLRIVELTCMLVHTKYPDAIARVIACPGHPLDICLDLFFQFEWNNCLHSVVERTLQFCLRGGVSEESIGFDDGSEDSAQEDEDIDGAESFFGRREGITIKTGESSTVVEMSEEHMRLRQEELAREQHAANLALVALQHHIFQQCKLVQRLLQAYGENRESVSETEKFWAALDEKRTSEVRGTVRSCGQRGYIGFCHRIVNTVALVASINRSEREQRNLKGETSSDQTSIDPSSWPALDAIENNEEWASLLEGEISDINAVEQCLLGGMRPRTSSIPTSEGLGAEIEDFDGSLFLSATRASNCGDGMDDDFKPFGAFQNLDAGVAQGVSFEFADDDDEDDDEFARKKSKTASDGAVGFNPFGVDDQPPPSAPSNSSNIDPFGSPSLGFVDPFAMASEDEPDARSSVSNINGDNEEDEFSAIASDADPFEADSETHFDPFGSQDNYVSSYKSEATSNEESLAAILDSKLSLQEKEDGKSNNSTSRPSSSESDWVPDFSS